jgi:hypothetical protein
MIQDPAPAKSRALVKLDVQHFNKKGAAMLDFQLPNLFGPLRHTLEKRSHMLCLPHDYQDVVTIAGIQKAILGA